MSHDLLVRIAQIFGPIWMMGIFLIVLVRVYWPSRRAVYDRAARSVLEDRDEGEDRA